MKRLLACSILLVFFPSSPPIVAQGTGAVNAGAPAGVQDPELTRPSIILSGKVVMDDGTPLSGTAAVQTVCKGLRRTVANTDARGGFSFTLIEQDSGARSLGTGISDASVSGSDGLPIGHSFNALHNSRQWRECAVQVELPGFTSEVVPIISRVDNRGGNVGSITIHRIAQVEGLTISATSAAAPEAARKALEKGHEREKNNKWDEARQAFQSAVKIYPQYAVAWFELGRIDMQRGDISSAKQAFSKSLEADSTYINPYLGLAQIAGQEQNWQGMADMTARIVTLNPINFPNAWFFNGYANYNLGKLPDAEKSALEGLRIDSEHHYPRLEYLLGMVLLEQHDYAGASEHMQNFLRAVKDPREVAEAQKQLAEIARLRGTTTTSAQPEKK